MPQDSPIISGRLFVPRSRALVTDVLRLHRLVPTCAHDRRFQLDDLSEMRTRLASRISWSVLFLKAYSAVSARNPKLLQTWRTWPFAHVFQQAEPVATVATNRRFQDEDWLLWGRIQSPQSCSLVQIQNQMDRFVNGPVEEVFRQQLQFSLVPALLRRFVWWWNLNLSGEKRAKRVGTFLLTTLAGRQTEISHPPGFLTSSLTYGPLAADGSCRVTLVYDHRLMDGAFVADRLAELEAELKGAILAELRDLAAEDAALQRAA